MVVRVAIEDVLVVVWIVRHKLDEDAVLLKEVCCFQSARLRELSIIGSCRVEVGIGLCALFETSEDYDLICGDL